MALLHSDDKIFQGPLQRAIHVYKYRPRPELATALAGCLEAAVRKSGIGIAVLTFVPLHPARQRERGFNQAERLARRLGQAMAVPVIAGLSRVRATPAQVGLGEAERRVNMVRAFCWSATERPSTRCERADCPRPAGMRLAVRLANSSHHCSRVSASRGRMPISSESQ